MTDKKKNTPWQTAIAYARTDTGHTGERCKVINDHQAQEGT